MTWEKFSEEEKSDFGGLILARKVMENKKVTLEYDFCAC